ncbi:MAG: hypothetical protein ABFC84_12550 [Veillonellales bacterium]
MAAGLLGEKIHLTARVVLDPALAAGGFSKKVKRRLFRQDGIVGVFFTRD